MTWSTFAGLTLIATGGVLIGVSIGIYIGRKRRP